MGIKDIQIVYFIVLICSGNRPYGLLLLPEIFSLEYMGSARAKPVEYRVGTEFCRMLHIL